MFVVRVIGKVGEQVSRAGYRSLFRSAARTVFGLVLFAGVVASGQEPSGAPSDAQSTYTLRTGTNLVVEDITVTGADGRPVHGLKAQDFVLTENGHPERLRNFVEHEADAPKSAVINPPKLAPGMFTNYAQTVSSGPVNVLLLDMLNTPLRDQQFAKQQIQQFLDHAPAGLQMAVFGLSSKLTLLQGFTSDYGLLKAALNRRRSSATSSLLDDTQGGGGSGTNPNGISEAIADNSTSPDAQELLANAQQFEADTQSLQLNLRTEFTLDALNGVARYLANIPGRKNLIWFSGSFPIDLLPSTSTGNGFNTMASHDAEFRDTMTLLARSQVALYPVDARGLQTTGTFNAASQTTKYNRDATALGKDIASFNAQIASENTAMLAAAHETGGQAFINSNGLKEAVAAAIENGSNYYTLTYTPSPVTPVASDDNYRKVTVSLPGKLYTLSYRHGYYADVAANETPGKGVATARQAENPAAASLITRSMVRGAPVPTQIEFTIRVRPVTGREEAVVAPGNVPAANGKASAGPYLRLAIDYAIDQHALSFQSVEGKFRGDFEFTTFVYDADGNLLNRVGSTLHADLTPVVYAEFQRRPFSFNQDVSVPRSGELFLRTSVHDLNTDHVGAVEVPVDSVRKLPPLSTPKSE